MGGSENGVSRQATDLTRATGVGNQKVKRGEYTDVIVGKEFSEASVADRACSSRGTFELLRLKRPSWKLCAL